MALDKFDRIDFTLENGVIVGSRWEHGNFLQLFHFSAFYVELRYLEDQREIIAIYSSDKDSLLDPYLSTIYIGDLL